MSFSKGCKNTTVAMNGYINFQFRRMMAAEVSDNLEHFFETDERPTRADVFLGPMGNDSGDESGNEEVYSFDNKRYYLTYHFVATVVKIQRSRSNT